MSKHLNIKPLYCSAAFNLYVFAVYCSVGAGSARPCSRLQYHPQPLEQTGVSALETA